RLTVTGNAVGTPTYMSPEQAEGEREVDGRSDIYSLGVLGYQMLTGRVPFTAGNSMGVLLKHIIEPPRPIAELRPDAPPALRDAIERALLKSAEDRWPTAYALREALMSERSSSPSPTWRAEPRTPVRYTSPRPESARSASSRRGSVPARAPSSPSPRKTSGEIQLEPEHLAQLTPAQRDDLRLWHGRVNLLDRVKAARWYALFTVAAIFA